ACTLLPPAARAWRFSCMRLGLLSCVTCVCDYGVVSLIRFPIMAASCCRISGPGPLSGCPAASDMKSLPMRFLCLLPDFFLFLLRPGRLLPALLLALLAGCASGPRAP